MATITYRGVGGGGNLFAGKKFFFLQRVPSRLHYIELVQANGGEIVKLEKHADIVIADHARKKDCPPGSISWKYIEESAKKGELEDEEDHRAGPATHLPREVGSGQPTKKGRTPFTAEDDRVLTQWCHEAERKGLSLKGNEIYKQLEIKNNRHPFQSWRDRWLKYLAGRPHPELANRDASISPPHSPAAAARTQNRDLKPSSASRRTPSIDPVSSSIRRAGTGSRTIPTDYPGRNPGANSPAMSARSRGSASEGASPYVAKSAGGIHFTQKENSLLIGEYANILNLDEDKAIDAWAAWAVTYPNHTAQEWRNYFVKELAPLIQENSREESRKAKSRIESTQNPDITSKLISPTQTLPRTSPQTASEGLVIDDVPESQPDARTNADLSETDQKVFMEELAGLAAGLELEVDFYPVICERTIPLFRLWQVVRSDEFGGYDNVNGRKLWPQVAKTLNFDDFKHPSAANDLKACYGEILADFEEARDQMNSATYSSLGDFQEREMTESQPRKTAARETQIIGGEFIGQATEEEGDESANDLDLPLSSPSQLISSSSSKRNLAELQNVPRGLSTNESYIKRQRIDKGKGKKLEIPCSPEEDVNSYQMHSPSYKPSPLKLVTTTLNGDSEEDEKQELDFKPFRRFDFSPDLSPNLGARRAALEPETQDFSYPGQEVDDETGSFVSNSPSTGRKNTARQRGELATQTISQYSSSTQSQTESEQGAALSAYIERHIALGYSQEHVILALEATTMQTGDAAIVMEALQSGEGIPDNIQGVWTYFDDQALEDVNHPDFEKVVVKHGTKRVRQRQEYLLERREASRQLSQSFDE